MEHLFLLNIYFKYCLLIDVCSKCFYCYFRSVVTQFPLILFWCCRISKRVWNGDGRHDSVGSYCFCYRNQVTHLYDWKSCSFNLFYHRCTATCTGTSSAHHDDAVYVVFQKIWHDLFGHSCCLGLCCSCSYCCVEIVM